MVMGRPIEYVLMAAAAGAPCSRVRDPVGWHEKASGGNGERAAHTAWEMQARMRACALALGAILSTQVRWHRRWRAAADARQSHGKVQPKPR